MKLNQEKIEEIKRLNQSGVTQKEIAKIMEVSQRAISYWINGEEYRKEVSKKIYESFKNKTLEDKKEIYRRRKDYMRRYMRRRYMKDESFREKQKERSRNNIVRKKS